MSYTTLVEGRLVEVERVCGWCKYWVRYGKMTNLSGEEITRYGRCERWGKAQSYLRVKDEKAEGCGVWRLK